VRALQQKIRHYDRDIERLCSFHFNGFIEAVQELATLRKECNSLRVCLSSIHKCHVFQENVAGIDSGVSNSSAAVTQRCTEIVRYRRMQKNIATAIDSISLCLPMLEKYSKLQEQMKNKRFVCSLPFLFSVLQLLSSTENTGAT
jgi:hypothetical protein